jgi:hypothetical protein
MKRLSQTYTMPLRLSKQERESLEWIALYYGDIPLSDAVRKALATECFLIEQRMKGATFLIEERGGKTREIVFR